MVMFDWSVVKMKLKGVWSCALRMYGDPCVATSGYGALVLVPWFVNSWDIKEQVQLIRATGSNTYPSNNVGTFHCFLDVSIYYNSHFGEGRGPYHGSYRCDGDEPNLLSCTHYSSYNCKRNEDAGVKCDGKDIMCRPALPTLLNHNWPTKYCYDMKVPSG